MTYRSYIKPYTSKSLKQLVKGLEKLSFSVESASQTDIFSKYSWETSNLSINKTKIKNFKNTLHIELKKSKSPFYFVLNSKVQNFKKLSFTQGIPTDSIDSLELGLHLSESLNELSVSLLIMEYDHTLTRVNIIKLKSNIIHLYSPSQGIKRIVVAIEVRGKGIAIISGLTLRTNTHNTFKNAKTSSLSFNEYGDNISTFQRIKTLLDKEDSEKKSYLNQIYKWKRRALQWEEKAKKAPSPNSNLNEIGYQSLLNLAQQLPKSNGCQFYNKLPYKVGLITDIYMYNFYKDTFQEAHYLSPDNYLSILESCDLDLILYVTSWKGINNEEWRGVKFREKPLNALDDIITYGRKNSIKLVFQSIEDPSNFEYFLPVAEKFDYIFTSDSDTITEYKKHLGHDNVFYGEYGFNPQLNNPIASQRDTINAAFFAGSYPERYKERCDDMKIIFDSILLSNENLIIADRNYGATDKTIQFPEKYKDYLIPPIDHEILQNMHKLFRFNLNFNSIKNSPTMCAMRVYELQAQGTILISNYAKSVFNKFPNLRILPAIEDMSFDFLDKNSLSEYKLRIETIRKVMNNKTSYDVSSKMLENIGLVQENKPTNTVAIFTKNQLTSSIQSYENKVFINISTIQNQEAWDLIKKSKNITYFTWFNPEYEYEKNYLNDMINGFKYTNASYITKNSYFTSNAYHKSLEHEYTDNIKGKDKTVFRADKFTPLQFEKYNLDEPIISLYGGYSIDPFELNYSKYLENTSNNEEKPVPLLSIIIPVYNNGNYLLYTCLPSIQKNKLYKKFEILLVDDGSTDDSTQNICLELERENSNIKTYLYPSGGSGSASRPRNKGIEMASAKLLTFLDPDNEISPGGYDNLINLYNTANKKYKNVSFVSGYNVKVDSETKTVAKHTKDKLSIIENFEKNYFKKGRFPTIATQAAVIEKDIFVKNPQLRFVEKSAGQDTLFGWELLLTIEKGAFTSEAFLIYYADREDSVTNTVDKNYFRKKLILEKEQIKMFEKHNLLSIYVDHHFDRFMKDWYLKKLKLVKEKDYQESLQILKDICKLYNKDIKNYLKDDK